MPFQGRRVPFEAIAAALYTVSLVIPAIIVIDRPLLGGTPHNASILGFQCLIVGWLTIPWYANVMLWIAAIGLACRCRGVAIASSLVAVGLALSTLAYLGSDIHALHVGYFAWLASMVVMLVASCADPRWLLTAEEESGPPGPPAI